DAKTIRAMAKSREPGFLGMASNEAHVMLRLQRKTLAGFAIEHSAAVESSAGHEASIHGNRQAGPARELDPLGRPDHIAISFHVQSPAIGMNSPICTDLLRIEISRGVKAAI